MGKTTIVCWPAVQELMEQEGFRSHSALCNSDALYEKYGDSSYAIEDKWLNEVDTDIVNRVMSLQETFEGPEIDFTGTTDLQTI